MNNLFTLKGRTILFLLIISQFGLKLQASANTRMVCDTDTVSKKAANSRVIKTDTTLILRAGSTIFRNADTIMIINGVPVKKKINSLGIKSDPNGDPSAKGLIEVKNNELPVTTITAPPTDGTVQVKNTATAPPTNTTIVAPPMDGIIQVKDATGGSGGSTNQGNTPDSAIIENSDTTANKKAGDAAAGKTDAATDASSAKTGDTTATVKATPAATYGEIQVRPVDTSLLKKNDTTRSDSTHMKRDTTMQADSTDASQIQAKGYYLEVGGAGLAISANYDSRFGKERNGWGYRIGVGGFVSGGNKVVTVPFQVNYLIGEHSSMFEFGAGTTFLNSTGDSKGKTWAFDKITGFVATGSIGYRYQPEHKGINFRLVFTPILYDEGVIPAGGISVGYTFK
jgi:hypothetical protein